MKLIPSYLMAFAGGIFLAVQAGFNTQLGTLLKQPILAVVSTSIASAIFGSVLFVFLNKGTLQMITIQEVPWYLWFIGGLFSTVGIFLYFYTIPKLGISKMIAIGLCGQLIFSVIAGKFGWLNMPVEPISTKRVVGVLAMILGIVLINTK